jgi:mono/diheme cytochrome c family protein
MSQVGNPALTVTHLDKENIMRQLLPRILGGGVLAIAALGLLIQLVPYGRDHSNPAVVAEPAWDSPRTRELFFRACADCHSNETVWPWYSHIAPVSWLVQHDVEEGREYLNVSQWGQGKQEAEEAAEEVEEGNMPIPAYLITHPEADLTPAEKEELIRGLEVTFGEEHEGEEEEHEDEEGEEHEGDEEDDESSNEDD